VSELQRLDSYRRQMVDAVRDTGAQLALRFDPAWSERAAEVIRDFAASGEEFDPEDVRAVVGDPESPPAMGAAFLRASKAGLIEPVGISKSTRIQRHGGWARTWRGKTRRPDPEIEAPVGARRASNPDSHAPLTSLKRSSLAGGTDMQGGQGPSRTFTDQHDSPTQAGRRQVTGHP
jgi:hypothetical protein